MGQHRPHNLSSQKREKWRINVSINTKRITFFSRPHLYSFEFGGPSGVLPLDFPMFYDRELAYPASVDDIQPFLWRMRGECGVILQRLSPRVQYLFSSKLCSSRHGEATPSLSSDVWWTPCPVFSSTQTHGSAPSAVSLRLLPSNQGLLLPQSLLHIRVSHVSIYNCTPVPLLLFWPALHSLLTSLAFRLLLRCSMHIRQMLSHFGL